MMTQLSNEARDKLFAAIHCDSYGSGPPLPWEYVQACMLWYAALSSLDKMVVKGCKAAYAAGFEKQAEQAAESLPPAPKWPL